MIIPGIDGFHYVGHTPNFSIDKTNPGSKNDALSKSNVQVTTLNNGLTIIHENNSNIWSGGTNSFVDVGSVDEEPENNGATHFLEHILFKRTKHRTAKQIEEEAEKCGVSTNAGTSEEHTVYEAHALGENILILTLLYLDMLLNNKMLDREVEFEKGIILEEAKMYEDNPEARLEYLAKETYFKGHPWGRRIIGTQSTISQIQKSDLKNFLRKYYTPDNIFISLSGNIDCDKAIKEIERCTSHIQTKANKKEIPPLICNVKNAFEEMDIQQSLVMLITKGYSLLDDKRYILLTLKQALRSRLFFNVREKSGYCYAVHPAVESASFGGMTTIYSGLRKDKVQEGINLILKELKKLKKAGLKPEELYRAKMLLKTALVLREESTMASSYSNGLNYMFRNSTIPIKEVVTKVEAITNEDIIQVANEVFDPKYIAAYVVGPKSTLPQNIEINL